MLLFAARLFLRLAVLASLVLLSATASRSFTLSSVLRGQVIPSDGGPAEGLQIRVRVGPFVDSARIQSSGHFSLMLSDDHLRDTVTFVVDAVDPTNRRYHPALVRMDARELAREQRLVLVPQQWVIPSGSFAGTAVQISLHRAFQPPCHHCPAFFRRGSSALAFSGEARIPGWPEESFPLRIAFDRAYSDEVLTARDSTAFWRIVDNMQSDFGSELFRPARYVETLPTEDEPSNTVVVWIVPNLHAAGRGSVGFYQEEIIFGAVWLKHTSSISGFQGASLVTHELMHALGFGHTCSWRSVLADVTRCAGRRSASLTREDVAYVQLAHHVSALARKHQARWGIQAALAGERIFLLGLSAQEEHLP